MGFATAEVEGKEEEERFEEIKKEMLEELRRQLRPELLNRIDEVIVFHPLRREEIEEIVELFVGRVAEQLESRAIKLEVSEAARALLAREGFDRVYGARPLRRAVQRLLENPLASSMLRGEFREGDTVLAEAEGDKIVFRLVVPAAEGKAAAVT